MQKADADPWERILPDLADVLVGELADRGNWVVANVEPTSFWPVKSQKVSFRGRAIWILPITKGHFPALAMKHLPIWGGMNADEC